MTLSGPGVLSDPDQSNAFYKLNVAAPGATVMLGTDITTTNHGTVIGGEVDFHNGSGATWHLQGTGDVFSNQGSLWAGFGNGGYIRYENASSTIPMTVVGMPYGWASLQLVSIAGASATFQQTGDITAIDDVLTMVDTAGGSVDWVTNSHAIESSSWMSLGNWGSALGGTTMECGASQVSVPAIAWFTTPWDDIRLDSSTWTVSLFGAWDPSTIIEPGTSTVIASNDLGVFWTSIPESFYNLIINAPGGVATAFGDMTIAGELYVEAGTLLANGHRITAKGSVDVATDATLDVSGQTLELASPINQRFSTSAATGVGTLEIDGGIRTVSLPNGVSCGAFDVAAGPTITMGSGSTLDTSSLLLAGTQAEPITLLSSDAGIPWLLNLTNASSQSLTYVAVQDSQITNGALVASAFGVNLGGNTQWVFPQSASAPVITSLAISNHFVGLGHMATLTATALAADSADVLFYTWSSQPAGVSFTSNGTSTAATTIATFSGSLGTNAITVTVSDSHNQSASSSLDVLVSLTSSDRRITPATVVLNPGQQQTFTVTDVDSMGHGTVLGNLGSSAWTHPAALGMMDNQNTLTAGSTPGSYSLGIFSALVSPPIVEKSSIRINAPPVISMQPIYSLQSGGTSATLSVGAADDGGASNLSYAWQQTSGPSATLGINHTVSANTITTTLPIAGTYVFAVVVSDAQGLQVRSSPLSITTTSSGLYFTLSSLTIAENATTTADPGFATVISPAGTAVTYTTTVQSTTNPQLFSSPPMVTPQGTLNYGLTPGANGTATLAVTATSVGFPILSGTATTTITVYHVNQPPSFTPGQGQSVLTGQPYTIPGWATNISPGPASESNQTVSFLVTVDNPGMFSAQPAIDPTGTLSFSTSSAYGSAIATVVLEDSGGTAHGGNDRSAPITFTITDPPPVIQGHNGPPVYTNPSVGGFKHGIIGTKCWMSITSLTVVDANNNTISLPLSDCAVCPGFVAGPFMNDSGYGEESLPTVYEYQVQAEQVMVLALARGAFIQGETLAGFPLRVVSIQPIPDADGPCLSCLNAGSASHGPSSAENVSTSILGTVIDTQQADPVTVVTDFQSAAPGQGSCHSCNGAPSPSNSLPTLQMHRIHRYQHLGQHASFGPGVYSNFDFSLSNMTAGSISVWDPECAYALTMTPRIDGTTGRPFPGVYFEGMYAAYQKLSVYDSSGAPTSDPTRAATAVLLANNGWTYSFDIIPTAPAASGRLTAMSDRNGASVSIGYFYDRDTALSTLGGDPTKLWEMSTITDAYGRMATVSYAPVTVAGQWPIQSITLPNGGRITYAYNEPSLGLSSVAWSTGNHASFALDTSGPLPAVVMNDGAADGAQRHKSIAFTKWIAPTDISNANYSYPGAVNTVASVSNGSGEMAYQNTVAATSTGPGTVNQSVVFTGGNVYTRLTTTDAGLPVLSEQATNPQDPQHLAWYTLDAYGASPQHSITGITDALSHFTAFSLNSENQPTATTFPDSSMETSTYNAFSEPLHVVDRTGLITDYVYDAMGNLLQKTVATGTSMASTWLWQYNSWGQVTQATDANGNVTSYLYQANHLLAQRIDPADVAGGPLPTSSYTYDAAGRLATSTDASGRTTSFAYDQQDRLITVTYADGSTELTTYGTGELSHLIVSTTDRNGHVTAFGYDAAGRKISQMSASGLPEAVTDTWSYLTGTDLVQSSTHNGNQTDYQYDYRNRLIAITTHPSAVVALTSSSTYDAADRLIATTDAYGRCTYTVYDVNDRVIRTVQETVPRALASNPTSAQLTSLVRTMGPNAAYLISDTTYDAEGRTLTSTDPRGIISAQTYDLQGRRSAESEATGTPDASQVSFLYDAQGNVTTEQLPRTFTTTDPLSYQTISTWTGRNLLLSKTEAAGRPEQATLSYTYTLTGKLSTITDANGHTTTDTYEVCCDRLYQILDALGGTTTYGYDAVGNTTGMTDANGNTTSMTYDGLNRLRTSTNGAGNLTSYTYDDDLTDGHGIDATLAGRLADLLFVPGAVGSAVAVTDPTHGVTIMISDGIGRTVRSFDPNANSTTTTYDLAVGGVTNAPMTSQSTIGVVIATAHTDPLGHPTTEYVDGAGRVIATTDALSQWTFMGVDANGNQLTIRDPSQVGQNCSYDNRNRRTVCTDTQGDATSQGYDADGNVVSMMDGEGAHTTASFDGRDRRVILSDRIAATTTYAYDGMNHVLSITDAEGGVTSYVYDARNLLISESFPGTAGGSRTYSYDAGDRLSTRLDQSGLMTTYHYDAANRLIARQYPDGMNDQFAYDASGRLITATSGRYQNTVTRSYDPAGRLMDESISVPGSPEQGTSVRYDVNHGYDNANRDILTSYPDSSHVTRTYTARNQLASVSYGGSAVASRLYDLDGRLITTTFGNGLAENRTYRADNTVNTMGVTGVTSFSYQYDHDKRKHIEADGILAAQSQTFTYDAEGRIVGWVQGTTATSNWTLSPVGDWLSATRNGVFQADGHNSVHEMTTVGAQTLAYDSKGNQRNDPNGNGFTWDVENRLATAVGPGATSLYQYDALGRRVRKTVNGVTTTFVSAGNQEVWEVDTNQSVYSAIHANGGPATPTCPLGGILSGTNVTRIDFQTPGAVVPSGYNPDSGGSFSLQGSGLNYGWANRDQLYTHEYTSMPLQQYNGNDALQSPGQPDGSWSLSVPNGTYPVVVVMGDAGRRDMANNIIVGGVTCADPNPDAVNETQGYEAGRFVGYAVQVTVSNGSLSLTTAAGAVNARACFIEVGAAGGSIDAATQQRLTSLVSAMTEATAGTPPKIATRAHVYGSYIDEPLLYVDNGTSYYVHSNDLYSVAALTDSTGAVVERYSYDAYGRQTVEAADGIVRLASSYGEPWGFTGRRGDAETGLMYFRARMYSPDLGRFVERDPKKYIESYNLYAACFIPNRKDPSGFYTGSWTVTPLPAVTTNDAGPNPRHGFEVKFDPSGKAHNIVWINGFISWDWPYPYLAHSHVIRPGACPCQQPSRMLIIQAIKVSGLVGGAGSHFDGQEDASATIPTDYARYGEHNDDLDIIDAPWNVKGPSIYTVNDVAVCRTPPPHESDTILGAVSFTFDEKTGKVDLDNIPDHSTRTDWAPSTGPGGVWNTSIGVWNVANPDNLYNPQQ